MREVIEHSKHSFSIPTQFELIKKKNGSFLFVDEKNRIVKITWYDKVDLDTAQTLLDHGADLIESGYYKNILLNRKELKEFSTEARIWIKNDLLINRGRKLIQNVKSIATVKPESTGGSIFSTFINSAISTVFPSLNIKKFYTEDEAYRWLI